MENEIEGGGGFYNMDNRRQHSVFCLLTDYSMFSQSLPPPHTHTLALTQPETHRQKVREREI